MTTPDTPGSLHSQIMALNLGTPHDMNGKVNERLCAYREGAFDMRRRCASLVAGHETPVDVEAAVKRIADKLYPNGQYMMIPRRDGFESLLIGELRPLLSGAPAGGGEQGGEGRG